MLKLFTVSEKERHENPMRGYWCECYVCIAENETEAVSMHPYLEHPSRLVNDRFLIVHVADIINGKRGLVSKNYLYDKR
jgi:hypothetical protein